MGIYQLLIDLETQCLTWIWHGLRIDGRVGNGREVHVVLAGRTFQSHGLIRDSGMLVLQGSSHIALPAGGVRVRLLCV